MIHIGKGFSIVNKAEVDVFLEFPYFFYDPRKCWQFDLWFLCISKASLYIWSSQFMYSWSLAEGILKYFASMWTENFQMYRPGLEKAEEPEIKLPIFVGSWRKQRNFRKTSASLTTLKPLTVWITTNCGKFLRWEYQTTLSVSWETCMWVKKQQLEPDVE